MNVLVLAPHPDDEVLGCGGTICRHVASGDTVFVVVATRGIPELFSDELIETGRSEARRAHALLGVSETRFLDFPAPALDTVPGYVLAGAILDCIRDVRPEVLYVPHHGDIHSDHFHLHQAALVAARPLGDSPIRRILAYETLSETEWAPPQMDAVFYPTVFIDVSTFLQNKLDAMSCFESQLKPAPNARSLRNITALAHYRGATVACDAAEGFMLIREILRSELQG
ncbi:MAG: PIG-L family deacetylase [Planctomycetota bacterium]|nr:PIG-L family deacetylase [Planctomycetota bacterium]